MNDKTRKLLALAFDAAADDPEACTAFLKAKVQVLAAGGFRTVFDSAPGPPVAFPDPPMPFGKYRGARISAILTDDPGYLVWILENCDTLRPIMRNVIAQHLSRVPV